MDSFKSIIARHQLDAMVNLLMKLPEGDFAEVGVFHGGSAYELYKVCLRQNRNLHLFDTFSGTPYSVKGLDHHKIDREFEAEEAPKRIRALMPLAKLHIGIYPETHPEDLTNLAFIHCDCDQYESYRAVIDNMWPLLVPGGIILFDDYPYLAGAKKAVEESFSIDRLKLCGARYYVVKSSEHA